MAKATATAKSAGERVPKKGKQTHGGGPEKRTPKKDRTDKFCKWCKAVGKPFMTHNTTECRRFNKDGGQKDRLTKPFDDGLVQPLTRRLPGVVYACSSKPCRWRGKWLHHGGDVCELCV